MLSARDIPLSKAFYLQSFALLSCMPPLCGKVVGGHACSTHMLYDLWVCVRACVHDEHPTGMHMCEHSIHMCMLCACVWCTCMHDPQPIKHHQPSRHSPPVHVSVGAGAPPVCVCVHMHACVCGRACTHVWYTYMHDPQSMHYEAYIKLAGIY